MTYNFKKLEKLNAKGEFIRVYENKINISSGAIEKIGEKFDIFLDKEENAILIKNSTGGDSRSITKNKSSNTVSIKMDMPFGRYFYDCEYDGGYVFRFTNRIPLN